MKSLTRIICALVLLAISVGFVPAAQAQEAINTVTVAATKEVDVEADLGLASFGVRTVDRSAKKATAELSERTDAVLKALRDAGFTNDELATGRVRLVRTCIRECRDPNPRDNVPAARIMGYVGTATVEVETNRLNRLGPAVDAAIAGGANSIRNVSFDVEDKDAAVLEALRGAMQFAKAKAEVIAEESGRTLGPALIVREGRTSAPERRVLADNIYGADFGTGSGGASSAIPFPVDPPTLSASARVTVTWELL